MQITALETIHIGEFPNVLFVRIHTVDGLIGLGETFYGAAEVATYLHESAAQHLLGQDARAIDYLRTHIKGYVGTRSTSAEMRGNSAVDIALWDLLGKATGQPVYQLLGGRSRERIRAYNTCAGYAYVRATAGQRLANWGIGRTGPAGPYEDLDAFMGGRAGELALSLQEQGFTGMK